MSSTHIQSCACNRARSQLVAVSPHTGCTNVGMQPKKSSLYMKYDTILHNYNMHKKYFVHKRQEVEVHIDKSGQPSKSRKPHPLLQVFLDR